MGSRGGQAKPTAELGHPAAGNPGTVTLLHTLMTALSAREYSLCGTCV